ncbi:MAG: ADP-forming succinate--CoA ligase subunit beta [Vampirovibrionales bacterium]|nr:ADP-forming succinate--CoA ligase subunit beta [Vampirovibrionales bacterium]
MKIHEYQAKQLFAQFNIPVPQGEVASDVEQATQIATKLLAQFGKCVIKAQIHAGGRGKGGGVKLASTPEEARAAASQILGMQLVTHQTGPQGQRVKSVLVEAASAIQKELYLSIVFDRASASPVLMASEAGGMDIEEVAEHTPEKLIKERVNPLLGLSAYQARKLAYFLNLPPEATKQCVSLIQNLYKLYEAKDCSLLEINPLILTEAGQIMALDGKINFEDNALFRQKDVQAMRDTDEEDPLEVDASQFGLNYIKLDGDVACMVNGAGLAMATMDIIKHYGAEPANFLDVGGGASIEANQEAFRILLSDKAVKVVFINIFGGILRCDRLAQGIVNAAKLMADKGKPVSIPIVIRMKGTNVDEGKRILAESGLTYSVVDDMATGAQQVVAYLKQPIAV